MDLEQFYDAFFDESFEALDSMEAALLSLDVGSADAETINTVFCIAHSIKGGAGMFGLTDITAFTHVLETLLEHLRSNRLEVTAEISDRLLESVDMLRELLWATQNKQAMGAERTAALGALLEAASAAQSASAAAAADSAFAADGRSQSGPPRWVIVFRPRPELLANGNDPVRLFTELGTLGALSVRVRAGKLPVLTELEPGNCLLSWELMLTGNASREEVAEVFEWAACDCDIEIRREGEVLPAVEVEVAIPEGTPPPQPEAGIVTAGRARLPKAGPGATRGDPGSIRINVEKIDELLNSVGEIVITQSLLTRLSRDMEGAAADRMQSAVTQLERKVRELRESVMRVRMLPIGTAFSRFPRLVRDLSQRLGKKIDLRMSGERTELDKAVLEKIGDPLVHLLRNSIDHGIEMPEDRADRGKPPTGTVQLNAFHKGSAITIEVIDDGQGLDKERILQEARGRGLLGASDLPGDVPSDEQIFDLIFQPGFSTARETTDLSGRGVGMAVVKRNIQELGGTIELRSERGKGTTTSISLPLTLAIVDGQSVTVGNEVYIVPLSTIVESLQLTPGASSQLAGRSEVFSFRGTDLPIVRMHELFDVEPRTTALHQGLIIVVEGNGKRAGLFVEGLLGQQQVVVKSMETNYRRIEGISGATVLDDGSVALILDVPGLIRVAALERAA